MVIVCNIWLLLGVSTFFKTLKTLCLESVQKCRRVPLKNLPFVPFLVVAGPRLLSGLDALGRTDLHHRARAGGRTGGGDPEAAAADAGGGARGAAAAAG